jgi:DNA polymerase-3 subunit delta'
MNSHSKDLLAAPWLQSIWQQLSSARQSGRLPHAVLLGGAPGSGQDAVARLLLEAVLCEQPDSSGLACGSCRGCHLRARDVHEDLHLVLPAEDRKSLSIEQIRELSERLAYAPQRATRRVALIEPAEAMSLAASNALLKTLEEPPAAALLILVSNQPRALLPTLRSRCGQWLIHTPALQESLPWLTTQLQCSAAEAHWRLALNGDAALSALQEEALPASLEVCTALQGLLSDAQASAAELVRREKPRLALLIRVLGTLLSLSVRPSNQIWPAAVSAVLALTARLDSSSLQSLARELWQAQRWTGTGVREDLQVLATLDGLRSCVARRSGRRDPQASLSHPIPPSR